MYNLDSLSLKYFYEENNNFINGAIVQKIQLPSRHEVILNLRNLKQSQNKKLYININPKYPHICFVNDKTSVKRNIEIPKQPPMFCMQLRKYLNGSKIKDFKIIEYERILELYFDYFDEIGSLTKLCLAIELMGKHSNIILYNVSNKIIIGSIHNISVDKSSVREIYGGINYIYPPIKNKLNLLNTSFSAFYNIAKDKDIKKIANSFYYFSNSILEKIFEKYDSLEDIFQFMQELQSGKTPEFICEFWNGEDINSSIDNYFSKILFDEILSLKKNKLKKYLQNDIRKLFKIIEKAPDETKMNKLKLSGDMIMTNLYQIKFGQKELIVNDLKIELDENLSASENAQKYYKQYKKQKSAVEYSTKRTNEAKEKLEYFNSIIFNIENSSSFEELKEIEEELSVLGYLKISKKTEKIIVSKIEFKNWEIYIGKNNKQNDYLISKIANGEDLWFHGLNFPSCHVILKVPSNKKNPPKEVLEFCAKLTKDNSKAKDSGKTSIIMTKRKNLKKPPNTYLGYVTYKNETEIVV